MNEFSFEPQIEWLVDKGYLKALCGDVEYIRNENYDYTIPSLNSSNIIKVLRLYNFIHHDGNTWERVAIQLESDLNLGMNSFKPTEEQALKALEKAKQKYPEEFL